MDAAHALADLTEISSQVQAAVLLGEDGVVAASTLGDDARTQAIARAARELLAAAEEVGSSGRSLLQLEISLREGSVFVVREGGACVAATTTPAPTSGLVFYDLKTCLRALAPKDDKPAAKSRRQKKKAASDA